MEDIRKAVIAIDFDGTCVTHEYPNIGKPIGSEIVLKHLTDNDSKLILHTMRCGDTEKEAVNWFKEKNIPLFGVNENPGQKSWTDSKKVYAHFYIDDAAIGVPLLYIKEYAKRPFVHWLKVAGYLTAYNLLSKDQYNKIKVELAEYFQDEEIELDNDNEKPIK